MNRDLRPSSLHGAIRTRKGDAEIHARPKSLVHSSGEGHESSGHGMHDWVVLPFGTEHAFKATVKVSFVRVEDKGKVGLRIGEDDGSVGRELRVQHEFGDGGEEGVHGVGGVVWS